MYHDKTHYRLTPLYDVPTAQALAELIPLQTVLFLDYLMERDGVSFCI